MQIYDLIEPAVLTGVARELLADEDLPENQFILNQWFPDSFVDDIFYEIERGTTRSFTQAMPLRSWTSENPMGSRPGRSSISGEIPPLGLKFPITEYDRIRQRAGRSSASLAAQLEGDIFNDLANGVRAFRARMAVFHAAALLNAGYDINENGVRLSVDFGRSSNNEFNAANAWSDAANGTPVDDEYAAVEYMADNEGMSPADLVAVMNRTTMNSLAKSQQYRDAFPSVRVASRLAPEQVNEVREIAQLPRILEHNAIAKDANGVQGKLIPDGKVVYIPATQRIGETVLGVPAAADEQGIELEASDRSGPVAYLGKTIDPIIVHTVLDAVALPVLKDPNATYVIDAS